MLVKTMKKNKIYKTTVDEDGLITFPDELLESLDWQEGDEIRFVVNPDNTLLLINITATLRNEKFSNNNGQPN